jgi:uncharacterized protein (DUF1697 family)
MALVVLLRGVNVGGYRTFRPSMLARELKHLDVVNIGAAGTFVVRRPVSRADVRDEFARRLPFDSHITVCDGRDILGLMSRDVFADHAIGADTVRFVSVLSKSPRAATATAMRFPSTGEWLVKILARDDRFVVGMYRRHLKVISYLGALDRVFGVPVTTRNWNTLTAIAKVLEARVSGAAKAAKRKRTIAHVPKKTRTALGKEGAKAAKRKRKRA